MTPKTHHRKTATKKIFKLFLFGAYLIYESIFYLIAYSTYLSYVYTAEHVELYAPYWFSVNFGGTDLTGITKIMQQINL